MNAEKKIINLLVSLLLISLLGYCLLLPLAISWVGDLWLDGDPGHTQSPNALGKILLDWKESELKHNDMLMSSPEFCRQYISTSICKYMTAVFAILSLFLVVDVFKTRNDLGQANRPKLLMLLIIANGIIVRLALAYFCYGNYDMESYQIVADIVRQGGNVYTQTHRYNYSPVWFFILAGLHKITDATGFLPFHFVVRSFLCLVDVVTLGLLFLIAEKINLNKLLVASLFFLNPVSFMITGYHGQFESLAIFAVVAGLAFYMRLGPASLAGRILFYCFSAVGLIIKHNIFYEFLIVVTHLIKRTLTRILLFALVCVIFGCFFLPYWKQASDSIIQNVFMYSSGKELYGISTLITLSELKYLFILGLFLFPFHVKGDDIIKKLLLGMLFFLTFTTGWAVQYFTFPVALGALRTSKGFVLYTVHLPGFRYLEPNIVWIGVIYWFFAEQYDIKLKIDKNDS